MTTLKLAFLGQPTIQHHATPMQHTLPDKVVALLAYLALANLAQRREQLAGLLWGNKTDTRARNNLSIALSRLKKEFGLTGQPDEFLHVTRRDIALAVSVICECDVIRFEAITKYPEQYSLAALEKAATLYRGEFLEGFRPSDEDGSYLFLEWKQQQVARLEQLAIKLFATLATRQHSQGNLTKAIHYAERQLALDPWQEAVYRQLMQLSAENGQRDQAITYYHTCHKILQAEMGIEPSQETQALFKRIQANSANVPLPTPLKPIVPQTVLPLRPYDNIIGRQADMAQLTTLLSAETDNWLVNLHGLGGIGKTSLAYATVRKLIQTQRIQQITWLDIDARTSNGDTLSSKSLLEMIVNQLIEQLPTIKQHAPMVAQRLQQVRTALQAHPRLVVVDNIETFTDDGTLSAQLFELVNPSHFLLISRPRLIAIRPIQFLKLNPLKKNAALSLVRSRAENIGVAEVLAESQTAIERLYRLVGGHPQALQLFVQCAAYFSAESILTEFEAGDVSDMDALYTDIYQRVWQTQTADARQLLDALRLAPTSGISDTLLQAYTQFSKARLWRAIRALVNASLLIRQSRASKMHYHIHSLTDSFLRSRDHQQQRSPAAQVWHSEQILAACAYWQAQTAQITPAAFSDQHPLLYRLVREGLKYAHCWEAATKLMLNLHLTIENSPYWQQWLDLHYVALQREDSAEPYTRYRLYSRIGIYHRHDNNVEKALFANQTALEIATAIDDPKLIGRQHVHLANSLRGSGEFTRALEHAQTGLEIFEALRLPAPFCAAALIELGITQTLLGNFPQATTYFEKATQLNYGDTYLGTTHLRAYLGWGSALRFQGNFQAAEKKYALAQQLTIKTQGYKDQIITAFYSCHNFLDQELLASAEKYIQDQTYAYHDSALPVREAGYIAFSFGRYYFKRKAMAEAITHLKATLKLWEGCRQFFSIGEAYALLAQASWTIADSQSEADNYAQKARNIFDVVCLGDWLKIAQQHYSYLYIDTE